MEEDNENSITKYEVEEEYKKQEEKRKIRKYINF